MRYVGKLSQATIAMGIVPTWRLSLRVAKTSSNELFWRNSGAILCSVIFFPTGIGTGSSSATESEKLTGNLTTTQRLVRDQQLVPVYQDSGKSRPSVAMRIPLRNAGSYDEFSSDNRCLAAQYTASTE